MVFYFCVCVCVSVALCWIWITGFLWVTALTTTNPLCSPPYYTHILSCRSESWESHVTQPITVVFCTGQRRFDLLKCLKWTRQVRYDTYFTPTDPFSKPAALQPSPAGRLHTQCLLSDMTRATSGETPTALTWDQPLRSGRMSQGHGERFHVHVKIH